MNKDRLDLESIGDCLGRIAEYTTAGKQAFLASRLIQEGVIRNLEVIGEATKNLSSELRDVNPAIPWRQIAGMRDVGTYQPSCPLGALFGGSKIEITAICHRRALGADLGSRLLPVPPLERARPDSHGYLALSRSSP